MTTKQIPLNTVITFKNLSEIKEEYGSDAVAEFYADKKKMLVQQGMVSNGGFAASPLTTKKGNAH